MFWWMACLFLKMKLKYDSTTVFPHNLSINRLNRSNHIQIIKRWGWISWLTYWVPCEHQRCFHITLSNIHIKLWSGVLNTLDVFAQNISCFEKHFERPSIHLCEKHTIFVWNQSGIYGIYKHINVNTDITLFSSPALLMD